MTDTIITRSRHILHFQSSLGNFAVTIIWMSLLTTTECFTRNRFFAANKYSTSRIAQWGPPNAYDSPIPLIIKNNCPETIWPAIVTQDGTGPGIGGFELRPGDTSNLMVSSEWQGRVWGRTNCSFDTEGTGTSNVIGSGGTGVACETGDCNALLNCINSGETPVTLAEFDSAGGVNGQQSFYDISLVDGYNLPLGIYVIPGNNNFLNSIVPGLTDCACIATAGFLTPVAIGITSPPLETKQTNELVANWCPWDLQKTQPTKPVDGIYRYPDDNLQRPIFNPCFSACAKTNSPADCCTGIYDGPDLCNAPLYSRHAKSVCPDAYSFAFDDQSSTFIIPSGGGWGINFCPEGRSTNILSASSQKV